MNGKYLATDLEPLQTLGDGAVLNAINEFLANQNDGRPEDSKGELVAFEIENYEGSSFTAIRCLIKNENGFFYRSFEFFKKRNSVTDKLSDSAKYGLGFNEWNLDHFIELRQFYLDNKDEINRDKNCGIVNVSG